MTGSSAAIPTNRVLPEAGKRSHFATRAIHAGQAPDPTTGAVMTPIYTTSTYAQESPGVHKGFDYGRSAQPDAVRLRALRGRSGRRHGRVRVRLRAWRPSPPCSNCWSPARTCWSCDDLYGGTYRLFERVRRSQRGADLHLRRSVRSSRVRGGDPPEYADDLDRDADQSVAEAGRSGGDRAAGAPSTSVLAWPTTRSPRRTSSGRSTLGFDIVVHSSPSTSTAIRT